MSLVSGTGFQTHSTMLHGLIPFLTVFWALLHFTNCETLSLSGRCNSTVKNDIFCDHTTPILNDISVEMDCSEPNKIVVQYSDISHFVDEDGEYLTMTQELILNCSSDGFEMESLCLLTDFGSVDISGAYILTYVGQDTLIPPGSTCIVSTCFAPNSYNSLYLSPSKSCLTGGIPSPTSSSTLAYNHSSSIPAIAPTSRSAAPSNSYASPHSAITTTAKGNSITTPTVTTLHIRPTTLPVTYKGPRNILSANESQSDVSVGESLSTVMLPVILTVTLLVSVLVAVITCVIWHLHVQVRKNKVFLVYSKHDMVFDPLYAPVDIDTLPLPYEVSMSRVDLLQDSTDQKHHISVHGLSPLLHRIVLNEEHNCQCGSNDTRVVCACEHNRDSDYESDKCKEDSLAQFTEVDTDMLCPSRVSLSLGEQDSTAEMKLGDSTVLSLDNDKLTNASLCHTPRSFLDSATERHSDESYYVTNRWNADSKETQSSIRPQINSESNTSALSQSSDVFRLDLTSSNDLTSNSQDFIFAFSEEPFQNEVDVTASSQRRLSVVTATEVETLTVKTMSSDNLCPKQDFRCGFSSNEKLSKHNDTTFSHSLPALWLEENCKQPLTGENSKAECCSRSVSHFRLVHATNTSNCTIHHSPQIADSETSFYPTDTYDSPNIDSSVSTSKSFIFSQLEKRGECCDNSEIKVPPTEKEVDSQHAESTTTSPDPVCSSVVERCELDSPCSCNESGYYGYQYTSPTLQYLDSKFLKH